MIVDERINQHIHEEYFFLIYKDAIEADDKEEEENKEKKVDELKSELEEEETEEEKEKDKKFNFTNWEKDHPKEHMIEDPKVGV